MDVKALLEEDFNIPSQRQMLVHNGQQLIDNRKSLQQCGIKPEDVVIVEEGTSPAEQARLHINSNPEIRSQFLLVATY
jgi:hypothetical protein